jgi:restriction endonuclease S subunit
MAIEQNVKPGWKTWRFEQMAVSVNDRIDDPSKANVEHYVGLEHLDSDSLKIRRWGSPSDVEATKLVFRNGDIIFGRRRAYQRKLAVADFDGICSAHAMVLRAKPEVVLPEFLPFFMQSDLFMSRAMEISVGSLSLTINWKTLAQQEFALPPLDEQYRMKDLLQVCEESNEELSNALKATKYLRQSLSQHLFERDETHSRQLRTLIQDSLYGPRFSSELYDESGKVAQLRTTDIDEDGSISYETIPKARLELKEYETHLLKDGDLVISRSGTCGLTAVFRRQATPTIPAAFLIRLRTTDELLPEYLHEFFSSPKGRQLTTSLSRGGVQKNINGSNLLAQHIPCPNIARQNQVTRDLMGIRSIENRLVKRLNQVSDLKSYALNEFFGE